MIKHFVKVLKKNPRKKSRASNRYYNPYAEVLSGLATKSPTASASVLPSVRALRNPSVPQITGCLKQLESHEEQRLQEAFRIIDRNGDGKISHHELGHMWINLGKTLTDEELRFMVQEADANGDGHIDFEEFVAVTDRSSGRGREHMAHKIEGIQLAFRVADADRDGFISASDLLHVMRRLGKRNVSLADTTAMVACVDLDGDGRLTYENFQQLMTSSVL